MPAITTPGRYTATITEATLGESQTGTPFASLYCTTEDGQHISAYLYLSEKAFDRSLEALQKLGFDGDFERLDQLNGAACSLSVEEEEWNGETRLKVRYINPPRAAAPQGLAAMLTARARGGMPAKPVAATKPAAPSRPVPPRAPPPPPSALPGAEEDDDVPF